MKKNSTKSIWLSLIVALVFVGGASGFASLASAQSMSIAQFVELLIGIGVISSDRADQARTTFTTTTASSTPNSHRSIIMGQTQSGSTLSCDTTHVNLSWVPLPGKTYNNIRVDDKSNSWTTQGWCTSGIADGDLCKNSLPDYSPQLFPVKASSTYLYWIESTDANGANPVTRTMTFSVPNCVTPYTATSSDPTITVGQTLNDATTSCTTRNVNLSWTPVAGAVSHNIRVDDETSGGWGGTLAGLTWCSGYDGNGDLCLNGIASSTPLISYKVKEGHNYRYWIDYVTASGALINSRSVNFSVPSCSTTIDPYPTITLGVTPSGATTTCTTTKVNLAWTNPPTSALASSTYHNIRVDDTTENGWGGKTGGLAWCYGYDGGGDLCSNGLTTNLRRGYSVKAGHNYKFWVHTTDSTGIASTTRTMNFSVPVCSTTQ